MLGTLHQQWWSWIVFAVFSTMSTQTIEVSCCWLLAFILWRISFLTRAVFHHDKYSGWRHMNVLLDSLKSMTLIMCAVVNRIFQKKKTTVKNGGPRVQYEVIVVICNVFASCRFEKLKIKGAWQTNHPVLLTQPSSLSGFSKYFVHNLFICHFSMNYADSENFRTNRGFSWHSLYMYKYFIDTLFLNLF